MITQTGRVNAFIDLDAVARNFEMMRRKLKDGTKMCAVIKADGYGHGAVPIAKMAEEYPYIWGFAVATADEALTLREAKISKPILILGPVFPEDHERLIKEDVRMAVSDMTSALEISKTAEKLGKRAYLHAAFDTGMSRIGFSADDEGCDEVEKISLLTGICLEGVFTHFARADETDKENALAAYARFEYCLNNLKKKGVSVAIRHCANSAAILELPGVHLDMVRAGISIYGIYPSDEMIKEISPLAPVMSLKSRVSALRTISAGTSVSYGGRFTADKDVRVATIPVGYADGYPRSLSGKGSVLIGGKRAPILGRVCMDQMMVDVTGMDVSLRDEVTLMGKDKEEEITVYELSELSGRFPYEFVCDISSRVKRIWIRDGKPVSAS